MKTIPQNVLVLIGCIILAIVILGVFGVYSTKAPFQRQAIHIFDEQWLKLANPNGLITISDIKPNSAVSFYYPDPDRYKNRDQFERFILIRLPDYLGGAVNDASAFRAYSVIDPTSHCILEYWPQEGRRQIEDSRSGNMYDSLSGIVTTNFGHSVLVSKNVALPYLSISSDEKGFLYVEPPIWTETENGVIGIGRKITETEIIEKNSREKEFRDNLDEFVLPDTLGNEYKLAGMGDDGIRINIARYDSQIDDSSILLHYQFCNCTKPKSALIEEEMTRPNSQLLEIDNTFIVTYPTKTNYADKIYERFVLIFYTEGYKITIFTHDKLEDGLSMVEKFLEFRKQQIIE